MAHFFKPEIAHDKLETTLIHPEQISLSVQDVLAKNNIKQFKNFRIVSFNNKTFYQVKNIIGDLLYFDASNGTELKNGDTIYAEWLSRYFLDDQKSSLKKSELITEFDHQYKYVNRYLPVYKITLNRPDTMEVYVETSSGKLATFNPASRQFFIWFFDVFHNWSFLDAISNNSIRIITMIFLLSIIGLSAISGIVIYGFFWKQFKKSDSAEPKNGIRKYHRIDINNFCLWRVFFIPFRIAVEFRLFEFAFGLFLQLTTIINAVVEADDALILKTIPV